MKEPKQGTNEAKPKKPATQAKQGDQKAKNPSGLDAAVRVLAEATQPMNVREIVKMAFDKGYWKSNGRTPHATIYSAILPRAKKRAARIRRRPRYASGWFGGCYGLGVIPSKSRLT